MFFYSNFWFLDASKPWMSQITCTNMGTSHALDNNACLPAFTSNPMLRQKWCASHLFSVRPLTVQLERLATHPAMTFATDVSGGQSWARLFGSHSPRHTANHMYQRSDTNRTEWTTRLECYVFCTIAKKPCLLSLQHWIWFECILVLKNTEFGGNGLCSCT